MRPPAVTPAGRDVTNAPGAEVKNQPGTARATAPPAPGHRHRIVRSPARKAHRRVSGPLTGPPRARPTPASRPAPALRPAYASRASAFVRALPEHSLLDRIVRGRAWIPLLGVMLTGIVAMQVEVLKLGTSIGRSIERGSALQSRNELLRASVSALSDDQRIERLAAGMGMTMAEPAGITFLPAGAGANVQQAIANIHRGNAQAFLSAGASASSSSTPLSSPSVNAASPVGAGPPAQLAATQGG